jgi:hemoglobin-like flavoprotein
MSKPKITFEQHTNKTVFIPNDQKKPKGSFISFGWKLSIEDNLKDVLLVITTKHEIYYITEDDSVLLIETVSLFSIEDITKEDAFAQIEQAFYRAYDHMLKVFEANFKETFLVNYEPALPLDISETVLDVLTTLPWS